MKTWEEQEPCGGGGTHLPRDASGLHGYVCIVREAEDTEGLNKMP